MTKKKKKNEILHVGVNQLMLTTGKIITFNDEQYEGINKIRHWLKNGQTFFTLAGHAGTGKQQPIDCKVINDYGFKSIGDLVIGEKIFGLNGDLIDVNGVFPQGIKQSYKITFRDGSSTECGEEHLWNVWTHKLRAKKKSTITLTTKQILDSGLFYLSRNKKIYKYSIPLCKPLKYSQKKLPIHPYLLGVLIGDGTNLGKTPILTTPDIDDEIISIVEKIKPPYIEIHKNKTFTCPKYSFVDVDDYHSNKLNIIFKDLCLNLKSVERFIPEIYKHSSVEQRYELLRGLMDTDGTSRGNRIQFSTSSKKLMDDMIELVQSLGGIAIKNKNDNRSKNTNYLINIKTFNNPFKIKRKSDNWKLSWKNPPSRHITSIEKSRIVEQICISVNSNNGLYLTDDFIVTHNTTCIKKIIDEYRHNVVVSAPTHKAKKVIANTTDRPAQTLHSLLGLRPDLDLDSFNPNDPEFNPIAEPKIGEYDFVIIDEASMINQDLYNIIVEKTKDVQTKVLFLGDPAQLPPVNEKESVVFQQQTHEFHQLTKIERQNDDNPIFFVTDVLRNNLTNPTGGFERKTRVNKMGEGITFLTDKDEFRKAILKKYTSDEFKTNTDYAKVIAWRNKTVMAANKIIRTALFGENSDMIEVGDILMGYRSVRSTSARYNIIENAADYRVVARSEIEENKYKIKGWRVKIREDLPHNKFKFKEIFIIDSTNHDNLHRYAELHDVYKDYGKKHKEIGSWSEYYNFRRHNILMKTINKHKDGNPRNKYDIIVKDMDYGMSITVHKGQGSTYSHVFVMENDIDVNWLIKEKNQLKYTSFTRPTTSVTVLTNKIN